MSDSKHKPSAPKKSQNLQIARGYEKLPHKARSLLTHKHSAGNSQTPRRVGGSHVCGVCHKTFIYRSWLLEHTVTHASENQFKCELCSKTFRRKSSLRLHMAKDVHAKFQSKTHACQDCGKTFMAMKNLAAHSRTHATRIDAPANSLEEHTGGVACSQQTPLSLVQGHMQTTKRQEGDSIHIKPERLNSKQQNVSLAKKRVRFADKLPDFGSGTSPSPSHTEAATTAHQCPKCSLWFNSGDDLLQHTRTLCTMMTSGHTCDLCGKSFARLQDKNAHVERHLDVLDARA